MAAGAFKQDIARLGLATEFTDDEQPQAYARVLRNRYINLQGAAQKRPGLDLIGSEHSDGMSVLLGGSFEAIDGRVDFIDEGIRANSNSVPMGSFWGTNLGNSFSTTVRTFFRGVGFGDDSVIPLSAAVDNFGKLLPAYIMNIPSQSAVDVNIDTRNTSREINGFQFQERYVFCQEDSYPSYYLPDAMKDELYLLAPIVERGVVGSAASSTSLTDDDVTDWLSGTFVSPNDLIFNRTRGSYALITSVGADELEHTPMSPTAEGIGLITTTVSGTVEGIQPGDRYEIWDLVDNNVFREASTGIAIVEEFSKNTLVIASASTSGDYTVYSVGSAQPTGLRTNDYIYNTTRNVLSRVAGNNHFDLPASLRVGAGNADGIRVYRASGAAGGDSIAVFKLATPVAYYGHAHYNRGYFIDARDRTKVRVTNVNDIQDFTTYQNTIESFTIDYGDQQPKGEKLTNLSSFQRFLVAGGQQHIYVGEGTNPIANTSAEVVNFSPVGLFSHSAVGTRSLQNLGDSMVFASLDGLRKFNITDILAIDTDNTSEVIKSELRQTIEAQSRSAFNFRISERIQIIHYPRRNWVMFKVGEVIYNFNYTPSYFEGQIFDGGTWSKFTGRLTRCAPFTRDTNGDLFAVEYVTASNKNLLYKFDVSGVDTDGGEIITTDYETPWLAAGRPGNVWDTKAIRPYFETEKKTVYTVEVRGDIGRNDITDSITVTAAVSAVGERFLTDDKYPLRCRGEQMKIRFTTSASSGDDIISKFILYGNQYGQE